MLTIPERRRKSTMYAKFVCQRIAANAAGGRPGPLICYDFPAGSHKSSAKSPQDISHRKPVAIEMGWLINTFSSFQRQSAVADGSRGRISTSSAKSSERAEKDAQIDNIWRNMLHSHHIALRSL